MPLKGEPISVRNLQKIVIAAFVLSVSILASAQVVFNVITVPGAGANLATAVNNSSQTVVNGNSTSNDVTVWSRASGFEDLGLSSGSNIVYAINDSGLAAGAGSGSGVAQAFLWQPGTGAEWLGSLGGGLSTANAVSADGTVAGLSYTSSSQQHAFVWTQNGGMQDLTPNLTSNGGATATAINSSDEVVGYYFPNGSQSPVGFYWTQGGGLQSFGPAGTLAEAVNNAGTIVGQAPNASGYNDAFSWTASGGMVDLGTLGGAWSMALGINKNGWIVGTSLTSAKGGIVHGFLWTQSGGMQDLAVLGKLSKALQPSSMQVNNFGVIAVASNDGVMLLSPKMEATISSSLNPSTLGQPVTFTATINSIAGPPPDGETVEFLVSGKVVGTVALSGGVAQFTTSSIPSGTHVVSVSYGGDANYLASNLAEVHQTVEK